MSSIGSVTSSSSTNTSSALRITGMASGLDVDATVKALLSGDNDKLDKMKQQRQLVQWKQDAYRDIMSDIKALKSTYFDKLNRDNYMFSSSAYSAFNITAIDSVNSTGPTSATATANASAVEGQYKIHVDKLATAPTITGGNVSYSSSTLLSSYSNAYKVNNLTLSITYNGTSKDIVIDNSSGTKTVGDLISAINSQTSGAVVAGVSELTGKFTIKTSATGTTSSISIGGGTGNLVNDLGIGNVSSVPEDAQVTITPPGAAAGTTVTKTSNNFTIDGVTYKLSGADAVGQYTTLNLTKDENKVFDKIKGFIDKYNELIGKIQTKLEEKKNLDYKPLTDAQKEAMTTDQITAWETKSKAGLLKGDTSLENMLSSMRRAFYDGVQAAGISLSEVGLATSDDISERGKIILQTDSITGEYKLKNAIKEHGAALVSLFTNKSSVDYSVNNTASQKSQRYTESGILQRINDIMEDYTTTSIDRNKHRGILVEKAGVKDTTSEYSNVLYIDLKNRDKAISEMKTRIQDKETSLYKKFSTLETYLTKLNSQSSWLTQQLSSGY